MNYSKNETALLILAAGMGSRYGGLKQLDAIGPNDEAILDYSVYDAIKAGFNKVVFIIRKDFEDIFKEKVTNKYESNIDVDFVFQDVHDLPDSYVVPNGRTKPWGTSHALLSAKNVIDCPFAVINADDFYGRDAYIALHDFLIKDDIVNNDKNCKNQKPLNFAMVGFMLQNTLSDNGSVARGICKTDNNDCLTQVEELVNIVKTENGIVNIEKDNKTRKLSGNEPVSMNMWAFSPEIFPIFEKAFKLWLKDNINIEKSECFIPVEIDKLIKQNIAKVRVLKTDSKWFGVTYKEDKPKVVNSINKLIDLGLYPNKLF